MPRSHTPHHEEPEPPASGAGGSGGDPPRRRPPGLAAGGGDDSVAAAEERIGRIARLGRPGASAAGSTTGAPQPIRGPAAKIPLKPPNSRHNLNNIRPKNPAKDRNTVVLPGTDVAGDLADITAGRATWSDKFSRYEVNGRTYAVESTGTVFPVSGPGLVNLSRSQYKVLKQLIGSDGNVDAARNALRRDPSITDADWPAALEVFRHHKSYKGGA